VRQVRRRAADSHLSPDGAAAAPAKRPRLQWSLPSPWAWRWWWASRS
jgi:hypothetical protein